MRKPEVGSCVLYLRNLRESCHLLAHSGCKSFPQLWEPQFLLAKTVIPNARSPETWEVRKKHNFGRSDECHGKPSPTERSKGSRPPSSENGGPLFLGFIRGNPNPDRLQGCRTPFRSLPAGLKFADEERAATPWFKLGTTQRASQTSGVLQRPVREGRKFAPLEEK